jgi:hypothetical protein
MADLTAAKDDSRQNGELVAVALAAVKVFKGANINFNTSGYAKKAADTASEVFAGVAVETVDNSAGAAGDKVVRVWRRGVSSMACSGATQAWVGQKVYAVDDNVVALAATTTNDVLVGTVVGFVSATEVRVAY